MGSEWAKKLDSPKNYRIVVQHLLNPHQRFVSDQQSLWDDQRKILSELRKSSEELDKTFILGQSFRKIMAAKSGDTEKLIELRFVVYTTLLKR